MGDAKPYLYEFLYRGRPPGGATVGGEYHVILAQEQTDAFGAASTATSAALTPEQASARGFDLKTILAEINADALAEATRLQAQLNELQARIAERATPDAASA